MKNLQNHIRNYELIEDSCNALFSSVLISDKQLKTPTTGFLLINIVQCIESIAKDLHEELSPQFPNLPQFKAGESFDYKALAFLDKALGLSQKQVKITSKRLPFLSDEKRLITPLLGAHESLDKHPAWSKAYQSNKHDLANSQNADPSASSLGGKASIPSTIQAEIEAAGVFSYFSLSLRAYLLTKRSHITNATLLLTRTFLQQPSLVRSLPVLKDQ